MIPGEVFPAEGVLELNAGQPVVTLMVANTGDRPVQVGSHYHFAEANPGLEFDRTAARGLRLDIAAGTAVRFEPGMFRRYGVFFVTFMDRFAQNRRENGDRRRHSRAV